jgi:hypothetical protein
MKCRKCNDNVPKARWDIGYRLCLHCGDKVAQDRAKMFCVVPMHKSNYMLVTNREDLIGVNQKGGIVK